MFSVALTAIPSSSQLTSETGWAESFSAEPNSFLNLPLFRLRQGSKEKPDIHPYIHLFLALIKCIWFANAQYCVENNSLPTMFFDHSIILRWDQILSWDLSNHWKSKRGCRTSKCSMLFWSDCFLSIKSYRTFLIRRDEKELPMSLEYFTARDTWLPPPKQLLVKATK